ncbi:MAG: glutaredoxin 3 [Gammaproteobacteria bacterium]
MYCSGDCAYCSRAERLLVSKGVEIHKIRVDEFPERRAEMTRLTGRNTVPQIFIGTRHVGGFDDLVELDIDGELDELLGPLTQAQPGSPVPDPGSR